MKSYDYDKKNCYPTPSPEKIKEDWWRANEKMKDKQRKINEALDAGCDYGCFGDYDSNGTHSQNRQARRF